MKRQFSHFIISCLVLSIAFFSCRKEPIVSGVDDIAFSTDTLQFDTVFTTVGSTTKFFKVFNNSSKPVSIPDIRIPSGKNSSFRMNVDGSPGYQFENVEIPARDSIYVFIEVTVDPNNMNNPFVITDSVVFTGEDGSQNVKLTAWGQNAHFFRGEVVCDEVWTDDKPYVIINSLLIDSSCTLTIEEGVDVFMHNESRIFVNGTFVVNGTLDNPVTFRGDRLEPFYDELPGQWDGIHILRGSINNTIDYAVIENGVVGVRVDSFPENGVPNLIISNTIIRNMLSSGILGLTAWIEGYNNLVYNCGQHNLQLEFGGIYNFIHCTFANYSSVIINHKDPVIRMSNYFGNTAASLFATFTNCIIYGSEENELGTDFTEVADSSYLFDHCLVKTNRVSPDTVFFKDVLTTISSGDSLFANISEGDYHLGTGCPCINAGTNTNINIDLDGVPRDSQPDMGCYEK